MTFSGDYVSVDGQKCGQQYIHKQKDKCCCTQLANLIAPGDECVVSHIIIFKRFIMGKIGEKEEILNKVDKRQKYSNDDDQNV